MGPEYVLYVVSGSEKVIANKLRERLQLTVYCPLRYELKRPRHAKLKSGQYIVSSFPLFPGYLFISDDDEPSWEQIHLTDGVIGVISAHGRPIAIPEHDMNKVRAIEKESRDDLNKFVAQPSAPLPPVSIETFRSGQTVEIISGFLAGQHCPVVSTAKDQEITLMALLFGRAVEMKIKSSAVRAI